MAELRPGAWPGACLSYHTQSAPTRYPTTGKQFRPLQQIPGRCGVWPFLCIAKKILKILDSILSVWF